MLQDSCLAGAEARKSVEPVRRWRYLRRVVRTKRKLEALVYQLTGLHPTRYASNIRDLFGLANTMQGIGNFPGR